MHEPQATIFRRIAESRPNLKTVVASLMLGMFLAAVKPDDHGAGDAAYRS
jgi:hypothetical protein